MKQCYMLAQQEVREKITTVARSLWLAAADGPIRCH